MHYALLRISVNVPAVPAYPVHVRMKWRYAVKW